MNRKVIWAIILWINNSTNQNFLGNVFIDNELKNKGVGKKVWEFVELEFPNTEIWKTETPIFLVKIIIFMLTNVVFML